MVILLSGFNAAYETVYLQAFKGSDGFQLTDGF